MDPYRWYSIDDVLEAEAARDAAKSAALREGTRVAVQGRFRHVIVAESNRLSLEFENKALVEENLQLLERAKQLEVDLEVAHELIAKYRKQLGKKTI